MGDPATLVTIAGLEVKKNDATGKQNPIKFPKSLMDSPSSFHGGPKHWSTGDDPFDLLMQVDGEKMVKARFGALFQGYGLDNAATEALWLVIKEAAEKGKSALG